MSSILECETPEVSGEFDIKPLSTQFYDHLLQLEEKVASRSFEIDALNEIVSLYAVIFKKMNKNINILI